MMNNLNSIIVEGNLTQDPELKFTPKGTAVGHMRLATNRYWKNEGVRQEEVSFFDIEVWGRLAATCGEYLEKGRGVRVVGRLKQNRWQDEFGNERSRVIIVGEHVEFKPQSKVSDFDSSVQSDEQIEANVQG
jgi:single-strand DNA-binding protein